MNLKSFQKLLFYLLLFLIPSNLGKHFIFPSSYVSGILVDYLVPTVYLTDIIILLILLLEIPKLKNYRLQITVYGLLIFFYLLLNSFFVSNQSAAFYKFCKLLELFLLSIYIKSNINVKKDIKKIAYVLASSSIFQSLLALAQWSKDGSVFNNYLFLGEQPYSLSTTGIKKIAFLGQIKAPPLGTFPHPNVLAGFLVLTFPIILRGLSKIKKEISRSALRKTLPVCPRIWVLRKTQKLLFTVYCLLFTLCLFLTFSFPAWLAFGIILLTLILRVKKFKFLLFTVYCLLFTSLFFFYQNFSSPLSFSRRQTLNQIAIKMFLKNPLTGVGLNNFTYVMEDYGQVVGFTRFLQPVHNVYLLILAETGIIGFLIFLYLSFRVLRRVLKQKKFTVYPAPILWCGIYFLSFFDHYLLTTQQGLLLSVLVFGLAA